MNIADITNSVYYRTKTNSISFPAADMLISLNKAYSRVTSLILSADGRWQWDDSNQTDISIATTALVASQQDYSIATTHLKLLRVELKPNGGTLFSKLQPVDQEDRDSVISNLNNGLDNVTTGLPQYYDMVGSSVFLYPIPNYSQSASLKLYYQRGPAEFTSAEVTTGTKQPGFALIFHDLIPLWVSYDYCVANGLEAAGGFMQDIVRQEQELKAFYGRRDKDDPGRLTMGKINFI